MSRDLRLSYRPGPDATPEADLDALVAVYGFLVQRRENRNTVRTRGRNHAGGGEKDRTPEAPTG